MRLKVDADDVVIFDRTWELEELSRYGSPSAWICVASKGLPAAPIAKRRLRVSETRRAVIPRLALLDLICNALGAFLFLFCIVAVRKNSPAVEPAAGGL